MIREGEISAIRIASGFRVPRDEVLRVGGETIQQKAGRELSGTELEQLIDEVLATNDEQPTPAVRLVKQVIELVDASGAVLATGIQTVT